MDLKRSNKFAVKYRTIKQYSKAKLTSASEVKIWTLGLRGSVRRLETTKSRESTKSARELGWSDNTCIWRLQITWRNSERCWKGIKTRISFNFLVEQVKYILINEKLKRVFENGKFHGQRAMRSTQPARHRYLFFTKNGFYAQNYDFTQSFNQTQSLRWTAAWEAATSPSKTQQIMVAFMISIRFSF